MILSMTTKEPVYRELQPYHALPPFTLLTVVGTVFGWFLVVWVVVMGRPLGALDLPPWLALAIGLPFGVLLPIVYRRMHMLTEVYPDRVSVKNGMSSRMDFPLSNVTAVDIRTDNIREDYNNRTLGTDRVSRMAYMVTTDNGVQLSMADGRQSLIGSLTPEQLHAAILSQWRPEQRPERTAEPKKS